MERPAFLPPSLPPPDRLSLNDHPAPLWAIRSQFARNLSQTAQAHTLPATIKLHPEARIVSAYSHVNWSYFLLMLFPATPAGFAAR